MLLNDLRQVIKLQVIGLKHASHDILLLSERSGVMRAVGEFCVHPGQGVCLVENVVSEPTPAYVLSPIGQKTSCSDCISS